MTAMAIGIGLGIALQVMVRATVQRFASMIKDFLVTKRRPKSPHTQTHASTQNMCVSVDYVTEDEADDEDDTHALVALRASQVHTVELCVPVDRSIAIDRQAPPLHFHSDFHFPNLADRLTSRRQNR